MTAAGVPIRSALWMLVRIVAVPGLAVLDLGEGALRYVARAPGSWPRVVGDQVVDRDLLRPDPVPPDPLELIVRDQQLAAPPTTYGHLALADGLRQLDRADAELGGGVRQAERRRGRVGVAWRVGRLRFFGRVSRAAAVHIAQVWRR
jgi:hypothetical protein